MLDDIRPPKPASDPGLLKAGTLIEGKGIYVGTWEPMENGQSLGRVFNLFADIEDLKDSQGDQLLMTFNDAVRQVASLRNHLGHDGGYFPNKSAILDAVRYKPTSLEKWFLPPLELINGMNVKGDKVQSANLYDNRNTGAFKDTFITKRSFWNRTAHWYLSLTELPISLFHVYVVDFTRGDDDWDHQDGHEQSSRVVRAELRP